MSDAIKLFYITLMALFFAAAAGCSSSGGKSCKSRTDCAPCEFCNQGQCLVETSCVVCATNAECPSNQHCDVSLLRCVDGAPNSDGDQTEERQDDEEFENSNEPPIDEEGSGIGDYDETGETSENINENPNAEADETETEQIEAVEVEVDFETTTQCARGTASGPEIVIEPSDKSVDFGAVNVGEYKVNYVKVCNAGGQAFVITNAHLTHATSSEFIVKSDAMPINLDPGMGAVIAVVYQPRDNVNDAGELIILSSSDKPEERIGLIGKVKPVGRLQIRPLMLQFQRLGGTKIIALDNVGAADLAINKMSILGNADFTIDSPDSNSGAYEENGPIALAPGEFVNLRITFNGSPSAVDGELAIMWHDGEKEFLSQVALQVGGSGVCANPDGGGDQTVAPLAVVQLDGSASMDANDAQADGEAWYMWDFAEKPAGTSNAKLCEKVSLDLANHSVICVNELAGVWTNVAKPQFFAELAGRYVITLRVNPHDDVGCQEAADKVTVVAVPDQTIHIQLRWSIPDNDTDLHLVRYHLKDWPDDKFGCFTRGDDANANDCHWQNCNTRNGSATPYNAPDWGTIGNRADDPTLDIDDIPGSGPENINLSLPALGDYFVAAEYYSGYDSPSLTVKIWLFGVLQFSISGAKIPKDNQHWNICWIRVLSPATIAVEPINVIKSSPSDEAKDCKPTEQ